VATSPKMERPMTVAPDRSAEVSARHPWCFKLTGIIQTQAPCEYTGFTLKPSGFFGRNPAIDLAPACT
jgi:hypothetical protein